MESKEVNNKNQIEVELKELNAYKIELESKISSLNQQLSRLRFDEENARQNFEDRWSEDNEQLERIDCAIDDLHAHFGAINLTVFEVVRRRNKICLYDTTRYIDVDSITYNRENLDEILDWLEYHKTYAEFYRDVMRKYLTFDKPDYITRIGRQMRFEVHAKDEALGKQIISATLHTLENGDISIVMQLELDHYSSYYELVLDDKFSYSVDSDDTITLSLMSNEVICKIDEVEERLFKLKESMLELYKNRKDMINY